MHWPRVPSLTAYAGVRLRAKKTEISATRDMLLGKDLIYLHWEKFVVVCWLVASLDQDHPSKVLPLVQHPVPRTPQSPTRDLSRDMSGVCTGSAGRKTVRFADESASTLDRERASSDGDRPIDAGYTIRPHYPTRVSLSTFHSNPTIATELWPVTWPSRRSKRYHIDRFHSWHLSSYLYTCAPASMGKRGHLLLCYGKDKNG